MVDDATSAASRRCRLSRRPPGCASTSATRRSGGFECELLELVQDRRIVFCWCFVGPERAAGPVFHSLLTITLDDAPGGATTLTLVHERLEALRAAMPHVAENVAAG